MCVVDETEKRGDMNTVKIEMYTKDPGRKKGLKKLGGFLYIIFMREIQINR